MREGLTFSELAMEDWQSGKVDDRLVEALEILGRRNDLFIKTIKSGHPLGEFSPSGVENTHFFHRAADIFRVGGLGIAGNETSAAMLALGLALRDLPPAVRPERIYGPAAWHGALGFGADQGFISDEFHDRIHVDHIHIGYGRR
jgi:hypothetical protein